MPKVTHVYRRRYGLSVVIVEIAGQRVELEIQTFEDFGPARVRRVTSRRALSLMESHKLDKEIKLLDEDDHLEEGDR